MNTIVKYQAPHNITITCVVSKWLHKDQVKVTRLGDTEFYIKAGQALTQKEMQGAVVAYVLQETNQLKEKSTHY